MTQSINRDRTQLEQVWQQPSVSRASQTAKPAFSNRQAASTLRQLLNGLVTFFTGTQQLRIWTKSTQQGVVWFAYDPQSDQRIAHCSEDDLRTWLEARHHH